MPPSLAERASVAVETGPPARAICDHAIEMGADFIVMAAHDKGFIRTALFGSVTRTTLHQAPCPVWFVPDHR